MDKSAIISAIDNSPFNRGLRGVDWVLDPDNIAIGEGRDIALFDGEGDGIYQVHFLYMSRGKAAIMLTKRAFLDMFTKHKASLIYGLTPVGLRHAKLMARWVGGKFRGIKQTEHGPCELFILSKDMWQRGLVQ